MKKIGRYDIIEELGRGAMGVVYKASDPTIGRLVAIKVLSLHPTVEVGKSEGLEMFMREARAAGRLSHPGIVTIYDAVEDPETPATYIVMELVPGRTLDLILASGPRFEIKSALETARQVADALEYAHKQNVIHRDLKPANILLTDEGRAKITDFGIAKFAGRVGTVLTDAIMGTPSNMAPEQVTGGKVDARSDLFSLGIILYAMLTGQKPFAGDTAAVMFKIAYEDPVLPSHLNPQLGEDHDYVVSRCLAKNPDKRYSSAGEFLDDLEDVLQGRPPRSEAKISISELRGGDPTLVARGPAILVSRDLKPGAKKKRAGVVVGVSAALACLAALLALRVWRARQPHSLSPPPAATRATTPSGPPPAMLATPQPSPGSGASSAGSASTSPVKGQTEARPPKSELNRSLAPQTTSRRAASAAAPPSLPTKPLTAGTAANQVAAPSKVVHLMCRHELAKATLTVSSDRKLIFRTILRGKKKLGLLGIKGGYTGTLSRPIAIPAAAHELSVRVVSADGSVDLTNTIPTTSTAGPLATLFVDINSNNLTLNWGVAHPHTP